MSSERKHQRDGSESKPRKKRGRPVEPVPQEMADQIIAWISQGKTLREFCRQPGKPHWDTVYLWQAKDEEFARRFAHARERGLECIAMECQEIADENCLDQVDIGRNRLRVETRLKLLAIWNPKKYGPKAVTAHEGNVSLNVITGVPPRDKPIDG